MRNYIERAKDFIEEIYPYIKDHMSPFNINACLREFNMTHSRNVKCYHGCARIALLTSDYVIKFDYDKDEVECLGGCENEVRMYAWASEQGFGYLFAEITPYYYKGHNFYIMPRIYGIGTGRYRAWHYMTEAECDFCERNHISDLHSNNYGFRNGKICIIDYAYQDGCRESDSESEWTS